jgi:UDP-sulfoquinovose synthase
MKEDAQRRDEALNLALERARELNSVLGIDRAVTAEDLNELLIHYLRLVNGAEPPARTGLAELATSSPIPAAALAEYLDEIITAFLVERSSLGTPAARVVRRQTPANRIAFMAQRSRQLASREEDTVPARINAASDALGVPAGADRAPAESELAGTCLQAATQMYAYLDRELADTDAAAIGEHLAACAECLQAYGLAAVGRYLLGTPSHGHLADDTRGKALDAICRHAPLRLSADELGSRLQQAATALPRPPSESPEPAAAAAAQHTTAVQPKPAPSPGTEPASGFGRGRILVLGGDGFCGWPTSLFLSDRGYDVTIIDNLSRRKIDVELEVESLTPIRPIGERIRAWREVSGRDIGFVELDLGTEYDRLVAVLLDKRPEAIVHFAEQRAAPYSMRSDHTKRYTVDNNVQATHNLLTALVATGIDASLVHLGTMGVYGYGWFGSAPIPEGYLTVKVPTPEGELEREILHPANPESVYHMTKTLDQLMFSFYANNDGLRITDLHQGIVWGTQTDQTSRDERLINRFDYDGDYGTVLNRFLMQAAIGHPLTVHGYGGQTRAFIHIRDTVRCIEIAITHPPAPGDRVRVLNQVTETHRVLDLAKMVADLMGADIANLPNPRREAEENDLAVRNDQFLALGLKPTTLSEGLLGEGIEIAARYRDRVDPSKIVCRSVWRAGMETADDLLTELPFL